MASGKRRHGAMREARGVSRWPHLVHYHAVVENLQEMWRLLVFNHAHLIIIIIIIWLELLPVKSSSIASVERSWAPSMSHAFLEKNAQICLNTKKDKFESRESRKPIRHVNLCHVKGVTYLHCTASQTVVDLDRLVCGGALLVLAALISLDVN